MVIIMKVNGIKFTLSGRLGFFKKPDVNVKTYFTYNNIHKVALLGLLGAVLGLKGYRNSEMFGIKKEEYPEFYQKLSSLKISIVPNSERGYFTKKVQYFNNSVGYASGEEGGNLMVFEQWLENPSWDIYLLNDGGVAKEIWDKLCDYLLNDKSVYIPYLGKNDFHANISNVQIVELIPCTSNFINSLLVGELEYLDDDKTINNDPPFVFTEYAPIAMEKGYNFYKFGRTIFTNCKVNVSLKDVYQNDDMFLNFY